MRPEPQARRPVEPVPSIECDHLITACVFCLPAGEYQAFRASLDEADARPGAGRLAA